MHFVYHNCALRYYNEVVVASTRNITILDSYIFAIEFMTFAIDFVPTVRHFCSTIRPICFLSVFRQFYN